MIIHLGPTTTYFSMVSKCPNGFVVVGCLLRQTSFNLPDHLPQPLHKCWNISVNLPRISVAD